MDNLKATLIDTAAFLALLNRSDQNHQIAQRIWRELLLNKTDLYCTSYVLVETVALVQNRLGLETVRIFNDDVIPLLRIEWVAPSLHQKGMSTLLTEKRRHLSLVDCVSFAAAKQYNLTNIFVFDHHFVEQGFVCLT